MQRYFLELSYKGTRYSGFQVQHNAVTIQSEVEKALNIYFKKKINLTGSSRTDAGVHALQNYFHFDFENAVPEKFLYNINAILPPDIVIKNIVKVPAAAHCRFDAVSREYRYYIYRDKNPFLEDRAYFYPYPLNLDRLNGTAEAIMRFTDFTSFSKRKTQVKTFRCTIFKSLWQAENNCLVYTIEANRFLRGMVRGLAGTMLLAGREKISIDAFVNIIESKDSSKADFSTPPHGLFLCSVNYTEGYFSKI
jgi:tRNA pseudouridine38-40 synthase